MRAVPDPRRRSPLEERLAWHVKHWRARRHLYRARQQYAARYTPDALAAQLRAELYLRRVEAGRPW